MPEETLSRSQMADAFNEWMRRYIEDPAGFEAQFETVAAFRADGGEPTYGDTCAAYLIKITEEGTD